MAEGNDRFDAVFMHGIKHVVIEFQTGFVGLCLVSLGEDTAPGDGGAEALEAQFCKESDIIPVGVIKVDSLVIGIAFTFYYAVRDTAPN